jgi:hypothetical protein
MDECHRMGLQLRMCDSETSFSVHTTVTLKNVKNKEDLSYTLLCSSLWLVD